MRLSGGIIGARNIGVVEAKMPPPGPLEIGLLMIVVIVGLGIWVLVHFIRKHW